MLNNILQGIGIGIGIGSVILTYVLIFKIYDYKIQKSYYKELQDFIKQYKNTNYSEKTEVIPKPKKQKDMEFGL
jgi:hypothetical protein